MIDRTASFVARSANPPQFEDKIRENQRQDPKFSFLNPADPYHAYYRHRMEKVLRGELDDEVVVGKEEAPKDEIVPVKEVDLGLEPPVPEFILDVTNINPLDLCVYVLSFYFDDVNVLAFRDIMKLTALFTARRGRSFLATLSTKEGRNYQFDFLRPTHSLFSYFNRLVDQYSKVLHPAKETLQQLKERAQEGAKWKELEVARKRARWEQVKREKEKKREDDKEAERSTYFTLYILSLHANPFTVAFAEIDWHDYAVVQTIEFTAADAASELPPPMSVQEVENMTLAQKRMAAMIMETTAEEIEAQRARQAAAEAEAAAAVGTAGAGEDEAAMEESDDEDREGQDRRKREEEERQRELERARAIQASSLEAGGPMKIRTDYIPKCKSVLFPHQCLYSSRACSGQARQRKDDHLYHLWTADTRRRVAGTHAYRVARSSLEVAT